MCRRNVFVEWRDTDDGQEFDGFMFRGLMYGYIHIEFLWVGHVADKVQEI